MLRITNWPLSLYRVSGDSMFPTFNDGDTLLGFRWFRPQVDQVVVANVDGRPVIKRVAAISRQSITLLGDNPAHSTDSRTYGDINMDRLIAKIIAKL